MGKFKKGIILFMLFVSFGMILQTENISAAGIFSTLNVNDALNAPNWHIKTNLQAGDVLYGDSTVAISNIPSQLLGLEWVQTASASKNYTGNTASFSVSQNTFVYIAYSDGSTGAKLKEKWICGYYDTGYDITSSEGKIYSVYGNYYPSGSIVTLGKSHIEDMYMIMASTSEVILLPSAYDLDVNDSNLSNGYYRYQTWNLRRNIQYVTDPNNGNALTRAYGDRTYIYTELPSFLRGADYIQTAADSKNTTNNPLVSFKLRYNATVYVGYRSTASPIPNGITTANGWSEVRDQNNTSIYARVYDGTAVRDYKLQKKTYSAGEVASIGNNASTSNTYVLFVVPELPQNTAKLVGLNIASGDGVTIPMASFYPDDYTYNVMVPKGTTVDNVSSLVPVPYDPGAQVMPVAIPISLPGSAVIQVNSKDGTASKTYTIHYSYKEVGTFGTFAFKKSDGTSISKLAADTAQIYGEVQLTGVDLAFSRPSSSIIIALYDSNNNLVGLKNSNVNLISATNTLQSGTIAITENPLNYKVKMFIWDNLSNMMPLREEAYIDSSVADYGN